MFEYPLYGFMAPTLHGVEAAAAAATDPPQVYQMPKNVNLKCMWSSSGRGRRLGWLQRVIVSVYVTYKIRECSSKDKFRK